MGYAKKKTQSAATSRAKTPDVAKRSQSGSKSSSGSIWQMEIGGSSQKTVMKRVEVLLFTSELADLIEAGMTLGQALQALANQGETGSAQKYVSQDLCDRIVRGETFSSACSHHPKTFELLYVNMIAAAEAAGAMVDVLRRLADHYERSDSMRGKIKGALSYPIVVMIFGVFAVVAALVWIIPKFEKVFSSMGATLPLPTRILIGMSDTLINWGWLIAIIVGLIALWVKYWKNTPSGRFRVDGWKLRIPLIKGIIACGLYASLAYTLKTLLMNGVNVLHALKIAEETCSNAVIAKALNNARKRVTDGTSISGPLAASGVFPRMMTDMLAIGEQAGDMISSLEHIGSRYQKEMDRNIASFTNALEPILIVAIAIVVGFIAISILTAVFEVSATLG